MKVILRSPARKTSLSRSEPRSRSSRNLRYRPASSSQNYSQTLTASGGTSPYHWVLASGQLPPGIALSDAGLVSGIPSAAGTFTATIQVTDSAGRTSTRSFDLRIDSLLAITTGSLPDAAVGTSYSKQLEASVQAGLTWSATSGNLPPGLALAASGLISGTPTASGTYSFSVRVASATPAQTANSSFQIKVGPALTIATAAALPQGVTFTPYSGALSATGGLPPYTWSIDQRRSSKRSDVVQYGSAQRHANRERRLHVYSASCRQRRGAGIPWIYRIDSTIARYGSPHRPCQLASRVPHTPSNSKPVAEPTPYSWAVVSGSLPPGLVLTSAGLLQGTPSTIASANFRLARHRLQRC